MTMGIGLHDMSDLHINYSARWFKHCRVCGELIERIIFLKPKWINFYTESSDHDYNSKVKEIGLYFLPCLHPVPHDIIVELPPFEEEDTNEEK